MVWVYGIIIACWIDKKNPGGVSWVHVAELGCNCLCVELAWTSSRVHSMASLSVLAVRTSQWPAMWDCPQSWWRCGGQLVPVFLFYCSQVLLSTAVWSRYNDSLAPQVAWWHHPLQWDKRRNQQDEIFRQICCCFFSLSLFLRRDSLTGHMPLSLHFDLLFMDGAHERCLECEQSLCRLEGEDQKQEGWGQLKRGRSSPGPEGFMELGTTLPAHQWLPWTSPHRPMSYLRGDLW